LLSRHHVLALLLKLNL